MSNDLVKVLLIDDDEDEFVLNRDLLSEIRNPHFQLDWVADFDDAIEALLAGKHDAYLIDYRLGAHTGLDLLQKMTDEGVSRAIIFFTGQGDERVDQSAMELGASDYLIKGETSAEILRRSIRYAIEKERSRARLQFQSEILKNVHDAVFYVDEQGEIRDWNEGASRVFGMEAPDAIGRSIYEVCCAHSGDPLHDRIIPAIEAKGNAEIVIHCERTDGAEIYIRAKVRPMRQDGTAGYVFCASDITNEKRLEAELVRISEQEQQRIGQDIHDDLCSQLSGIGCLTKVLEQKLEQEGRNESELVKKVTEMVADAGVRAREIAKGLVPTVLETRGLSGAIQELAQRQRETFGIDCVASIDDCAAVDRLDTEIAVQVYRVVQEAVNNAVKHSDAERIFVESRQFDEELQFRIRDDGKGMPPDSTSGGMGLLTMQRRSEIIGATFLIEASIGDGTEICLSLVVEDS
ncbi:MAG: PAS domain S-box protein [Verrucomicrobiales bacterium]|nr:PAS domain S-box protein [Verrucomicrobiales bacterium]